MPKEIIETKIFSANGDQDNYFFEVIWPSNNIRLVYSAASWSSKQVEFDLGTAPVRLWFDLRDDNGSKTWTQELSGGPTATSRLVLRRVRSGSTVGPSELKIGKSHQHRSAAGRAIPITTPKNKTVPTTR
ncbi:hypothetical protein ACRQ5Q_40935 (plasmid) [Bradyrhizobium sp. PMVTL-01]|uniref:hypothetical protein n=1 Tax=Bradyrhizobium sp. PMVTL-01 TaxID=3434999 RepID=UPI003F72F37C